MAGIPVDMMERNRSMARTMVVPVKVQWMIKRMMSLVMKIFNVDHHYDKKQDHSPHCNAHYGSN